MKTLRQLFFVFALLPLISFAQESEIYQFLKAIPGIEIVKKDTTIYKEFYIIMLPQAVDHNNPNGPTFKQRIYVGYEGADKPTVMETEGYGTDWVSSNTMSEPTKLLKANQLYVEHRYFGPSTPNPVDWKYLTAEQDAGDYHYIRTLFGKFYKGKWIATGVSKGGQTATEYKVFYPDDVDVTIPYVAPINYSRLDPRIDTHFKKVGTKEQRKHIKAIQMYLLQNKNTVLPEWKKMANKAGFKFTVIGDESAYDYSVLEFPFSFWQYTADEKKLPDLRNTTPEEMALFLIRIVPPFWYTEAADSYAAANYQFYTQLGYYEYNEKPFRKYLKNKDYPNSAFVPKNVPIVWDPSYQEKLKKFISGNPQHMIYIYGEADPWGATAAKIKPGSGSLKMVQSGGTHGAHIATLSPEQREIVLETLGKWLDMKL
ncbi:MAG: S28 family serine protease [Bacteroidales bacterium]|nr:S28 family serine protease [Bacteroidales bacterium]